MRQLAVQPAYKKFKLDLDVYFQTAPIVHRYPVLVLISGPSAVGKDTIARGVIARRPDDFYFVVTATTRKPRDGEVDGYDYTFVSHDEFARMIEQ